MIILYVLGLLFFTAICFTVWGCVYITRMTKRIEGIGHAREMLNKKMKRG